MLHRNPEHLHAVAKNPICSHLTDMNPIYGMKTAISSQATFELGSSPLIGSIFTLRPMFAGTGHKSVDNGNN